MKYICDCEGKETWVTRQGRGKFQEVPVDKDEICLHCGHYAVAVRNMPNTKRISPTVILDHLYCETNQDKIRRKVGYGSIYYSGSYSLEEIINKQYFKRCR